MSQGVGLSESGRLATGKSLVVSGRFPMIERRFFRLIERILSCAMKVPTISKILLFFKLSASILNRNRTAIIVPISIFHLIVSVTCLVVVTSVV